MRRIVCMLLSVLFVCTACAPTPSFNGDAGYALYVKDGELMMMSLDDRSVLQVTEHLGWDTSLPSAAGVVRLSEDASRLFYIDAEVSNDDPVRYLYVRELDGDTAPRQLGRCQGLFDISKDGQTVLYLQAKDEGGYRLYRHDLQTASLLTEELCGFGFTAADDRPYYAVKKDGETQYVVVADDGTTATLSEEAFETEKGGARPARYAYDGEVDLRSMGAVYVDGTMVDRDVPISGGGFESYFGDRFLYFTSDDGEGPYTLKQYVKGDRARTVDAVHLMFVGYTTDGCPLYLQNINKENRTGDLMVYRDGQTFTLDHGVSGPVSLSYITGITRDVQKHMNWNV